MINLAEPIPPFGGISGRADMVVLSQNETESLCMKAARGAGFSWGLAEEAGFAAGWLAAHGIDGTASLLGFLARKLGKPTGSGRPDPVPGHWRCAYQGPLCPITLGAALTDNALLADGPFSGDTRFDPVEAPLLLIPFLGRAAQICDRPLVIDWQGGNLKVARNGAFDRLAASGLADRNEVSITLRIGAEADCQYYEPGSLPAISMATLNELNALALKTTVPASDASRRGAGGSQLDND